MRTSKELGHPTEVSQTYDFFYQFGNMIIHESEFAAQWSLGTWETITQEQFCARTGGLPCVEIFIVDARHNRRPPTYSTNL